MHKRRTRSLFLICSAFVAIFAVHTALAIDFYVDPAGSNTAPYTNQAMAAHSIPVAVDLAETGDTVWVAPGTYNLSRTIDYRFFAITVRSQSGNPADTIVDGQNVLRCFHLRSSFASVMGFTIRNGNAPDSDNGYAYGGGV